MLEYYKRLIGEHIYNNTAKYFSLILCLIVGITAGALFVTVLPEERIAELADSINMFCVSVVNDEITLASALKSSLSNNLRLIVMLAVGSFSLLTVPLIYLNIAAKGFAMGFTVGFMSLHFGLGGLLLAATAVLPQSMTELPVILFLAAAALRRAFSAGKNTRVKAGFERKSTMKFRFTYCVVITTIILAVLTCINSLLLTEMSKLISYMIVTI